MESIIEYSSHPVVLVFAVILIAWIWEDAALVYGALLAADGKLHLVPAVSAVFIGICSGDLALYYLGRAAHRWRRIRAWILTNPKSREFSRRFRRSTITNIIIIRFIPGLRTLGFTLCGLWRIRLHRFLIAMAFAGAVWIGIIFTLVYLLGTSEWFEESNWKWGLMGIAAILFIVNNLRAAHHSKKKA